MEYEYIQTVCNADAQQFFDGIRELTIKVKNAQLLAQLTKGKCHFRIDPPLLDYRIIEQEDARGIVLSSARLAAITAKATTVTIDLADLTEALTTLNAELDIAETKYLKNKAEKQAEEQRESKIRENAEAHIKQLGFADPICLERVYGDVRLRINSGRERVQIHEWPAEAFANVTAGEVFSKVAEYFTKQKETDTKRISDLSSYLEKLIRTSNPPALERAKLIQPWTDEEEQELTDEQQEALQTCDLDC